MRRHATLGSLAAVLLFATGAVAVESPAADMQTFRSVVAPLLKAYCADCHGRDTQEAKLALHEIDGDLLHGDDLENWRIIQQRLFFEEMPPDDALHPDPSERQAILKWLRKELHKTQQPGVVTDVKLLLPAFGNYVDHQQLFAEPAGPVIPAPRRLWRLRPEVVFRLELGEGPVDELGRQRLSQFEIAAALSYALRDGIDGGLMRAATQGELADDRSFNRCAKIVFSPSPRCQE